MKRIFLPLAAVFFCSLPAGPAVPVIRMEETDERPKVAETGKLTEFESSGKSSSPRGSAAGRLAAGKDFRWTPSQIEGRATGGADIREILLSADESLLVMAERIGGENKPNSTRFILVSLRDKKIIRAVTLKERRITAAAFIPGTDTLIAAESAQPEFGRDNALVRIDLKRGKISAPSRSEEAPVTSLCTDGEKVWYTVKDSTMIRELRLDAFSAEPGSVRTRATDPRVSLSPDGSRLVAFGKGMCEIFKTSADNLAALQQSFETAGTFSPAQILVLDDRASSLVLVEPAKQAALYLNGSSKTLTEKCGPVAAFFKEENMLLLGLLKNDAIAKIPLPGAEPEGKPVVPGKLKPASRNGNLKLLALSGTPARAVLVDSRANVMLLEITKRRWKKTPVLTVDKTGFR
ncbi:MAG: hypothetical protein IJS01_09365 [Lentisphaeria bacterium]|nr:hypothetical protein [Lentisphaeria bacterium]